MCACVCLTWIQLPIWESVKSTLCVCVCVFNMDTATHMGVSKEYTVCVFNMDTATHMEVSKEYTVCVCV